MGGMFTVMKVREDLAADDYRDPGWYKHPPGTVAYEVDAGEAGEPARQPDAPSPEWKCRDEANARNGHAWHEAWRTSRSPLIPGIITASASDSLSTQRETQHA